ncbi:MAG: ABC transporter permease [Proteobacteria bacterium]|nr:ABC transporter permease [Pseudomonadota bacterium]
MIAYYIKLAALSIRRNPVLSTLMMAAIAVGIGAFMTMLTVHHIMSGNPVWWKNDVLYNVGLDTWNPDEPYYDERPELPPEQLTYRDAKALQESGIPAYKSYMFKVASVIQPDNEDVAPFIETGRMAFNDFFAMFDVPFLYGSAWPESSDRQDEFVVVLAKRTNDKVFGGENSVGESITIDGREYTVVGVTKEWDPRPKYYDLNNGPFQESEAFFLPAQLLETLEIQRSGNTNCWKPEDIQSFQDFLGSECTWIQYWVQLDTKAQQDSYRDFLGAYLQEQAKLGRSARPEQHLMATPEEWMEINEVVGDDNRVLVGLSALFLIVCLLNTVGLLLAKFLGRAGEISVRRALGASRSDIFRQQLVECGFIGLLGGVIGIGLSGLGLIAVKNMYRFEGSVMMDSEMIATAFVTAVIASIAAGLWPAWQICRVPPAGYLKTQ